MFMLNMNTKKGYCELGKDELVFTPYHIGNKKYWNLEVVVGKDADGISYTKKFCGAYKFQVKKRYKQFMGYLQRGGSLELALLYDELYVDTRRLIHPYLLDMKNNKKYQKNT
ncbi:hypothetical protein FACS1894188_05230 [Clostridia bacterium]|nr:hypothetical protein FACS1894188_05230 [Clostridia bacterium]